MFEAEIGERSEVDRRLGLGFIRVGSTALHVFERPDGPLGGVPDERAADAFARGRIDHFSLEAVDLDAFVAARDRLVELGATDGTVVDFGPLVSVFFADPDKKGVTHRVETGVGSACPLIRWPPDSSLVLWVTNPGVAKFLRFNFDDWDQTAYRRAGSLLLMADDAWSVHESRSDSFEPWGPAERAAIKIEHAIENNRRESDIEHTPEEARIMLEVVS